MPRTDHQAMAELYLDHPRPRQLVMPVTWDPVAVHSQGPDLDPEFFQVPMGVFRAAATKAQRLRDSEMERDKVLSNWQPYTRHFETEILVKRARIPMVKDLYRNPKLQRVIIGLALIGLALICPALLWPSVPLVWICLVAWCMTLILLIPFRGKTWQSVRVSNISRNEYLPCRLNKSWSLKGPECLIAETTPEEVQAAMLRWYNQIEAQADPQALLNEEP